MGKVSQVRLRYLSSASKVHDIHFTKSLGYYVKDLPTDFTRLTGVDPGGYTSEDSLIKALKAASNVYLSKQNNTKKMIAYKLGASNDLLFDHDEVNNQIPKQNVSSQFKSVTKMMSREKLILSVDYMVVEVVANGSDKDFFKMEKGEKSKVILNMNEYNLIDYSPERLSYFEMTQDFMQNLIVTLSKRIDDNI